MATESNKLRKHWVKPCKVCEARRWTYLHKVHTFNNRTRYTWQCSKGHRWFTYRFTFFGFNAVLKSKYLPAIQKAFNRPSLLWEKLNAHAR